MNRMVATVAVENTFFNPDSDYDYYVPQKLERLVRAGSWVQVPFGRGNALRRGVVMKVYSAINSELKELRSVFEDRALLPQEMISLALWMKERYFCSTYDCIRQMLPKGLGKITDADEKMARLLLQDEAEFPKLTPKQRMVTDLLMDCGSASVQEICTFCSVGIAVVKNLEKYGVLEIYRQEKYRNPFQNVSPQGVRSDIILSKQQNQAYLTYLDLLHGKGGNGLLFGVTGSGKTQVYLKLIDSVLDSGKDVIVMVPEIGLTPQMLSIFHKRYGNDVAVFHSGLSLGERTDEYKRADRGEARIVIGTRSAVFAPLHHLGLIIMDEEQENSYKSERTPRYHAREVARFRCKYNHALFLMTSATPSIESYSAAVSGKYKLCEISERYGNARLPAVTTVDMKEEIRRRNRSPVSSQLRALIQENFDNGKQTILLINRRGYHTFIACNDCGHVLTCPNCSISLTYHSYNNRLMCHYCGYSRPLERICPECGGESVRYSGYGTQRIEDEIRAIVPRARLIRMDADTTSGKFGHQKILDAFAAHKYDILIGTQMVAKGLDFPDVTLVGVVNADNFLYDENYISQEKCFDLVTQVIGRSGRRDGEGKAVIQTVNPYNPTLEFAARQDYKGFFQAEIALRKALTYPPFCDIYSVSFLGEDEIKTALAAQSFFHILISKNDRLKEKMIVLGPSAAKILKINNQYRYRLAIKCKNSKNIRSLLTNVLKEVNKIKENKGVIVTIDLNPYDLT